MSFCPEKAGLSFSEWLVIAEGVDANMGEWIKVLAHHARPEERRVLDALLDAGMLRMVQGKTGEYELRRDYDAMVKAVLKEKRKEDMNWLAFSLGYLSVKAFRREDLEMAVDLLEQMKASGEIKRADIGRLGWMLMGASMQERISDHNRRTTQISRTKSRKMAERGDIAAEDARLVKLVAKEGRFDLYYFQPVRTEEEMSSRHRLLCKYGRGTDWCTANPGGDYHKHYKDVGLFVLYIDGAPKYQFVDCGDVPESRSGDDEEEPNEESIAQFMDVNDQPVKSLTPDEKKFLKRNADLGCYDLIPDGFEDWEDFMASSDKKVQASSGSVASSVIIMAGDNVAVAMRRLGPALSRIEVRNLSSMTQSKAWGADMADGIIDGLSGPILELLKRESSARQFKSGGALGLMTRALAASSDPKSKVRPLADFVGPRQIEDLFRSNNGRIDDGFLKAVLENKEKLDAADIRSIVAHAADLKGILAEVGDEFKRLLSDDESEMGALFEALRRRKDGSLDALSEFLEENLRDLPPSAVLWCLHSSPDKEAAAKRMLSMGFDDERTRMIFKVREVAHLADDSHVRSIARGRKKDGFPGGIVAVADEHGPKGGSKERVRNLLRFLKNSDEVDGSEVMEVIRAANAHEMADEVADQIPQEMIDMISLDDLERAAADADKSCSGGGLMPDTRREGCRSGRPLVAVLKRTRLHFPMRYAIYMEPGKERDDLIAKNLKGSDTKSIRRALDLAQDKERLADAVIRMRGDAISPGEVASLIGHSKDKKGMFERLKGNIDSLHSPYEKYDDAGLETREHEDWMDMLMSFRGSGDIVDEVLNNYRKPLRPMALYGMIKNSKDHKATAEKIEDPIKALDSDSYVRLQRLMNAYEHGPKIEPQTIGLVDDIRHGGRPSPGDTVLTIAAPQFDVEFVPEDAKFSWMKGRRFSAPESTNAGGGKEMEYEVVATDGEDLVVSPKGEFDIQIGIHRIKLDERWMLKAKRHRFIRPD